MQLNGPQNTLPALSVATSVLALIVEGITTQFLAEPNVMRLTAAAMTRLAVAV